MITRACISINNRCNLFCKYCHFREKGDYIQENEMDVLSILDNIMQHIEKNGIACFKLGFVGNGEPFMDYAKLKAYILHISDYLKSGKIAAYTITNGLMIDRDKLEFLKEYSVTVGFSIDGFEALHNKYRCNSWATVMEKIELYRDVFGGYPSLNCTVGKDSMEFRDKVIEFFLPFDTKITFSRMIGKYGIPQETFQEFLDAAKKRLQVRTGGYDCTMYGGLCGAGMNNIFYANGQIYICGNCIDLEQSFPAETPLDKIQFGVGEFDRSRCYKEVSAK